MSSSCESRQAQGAGAGNQDVSGPVAASTTPAPPAGSVKAEGKDVPTLAAFAGAARAVLPQVGWNSDEVAALARLVRSYEDGVAGDLTAREALSDLVLAVTMHQGRPDPFGRSRRRLQDALAHAVIVLGGMPVGGGSAPVQASAPVEVRGLEGPAAGAPPALADGRGPSRLTQAALAAHPSTGAVIGRDGPLAPALEQADGYAEPLTCGDDAVEFVAAADVELPLAPPAAIYAGSVPLRDPLGRDAYCTAAPPDPDASEGRFIDREIITDRELLARQAERA